MVKKESATQDVKSISSLYAGSVGIAVYFVLIVASEVSEPIKKVLDFYPAVGPLLGKFVFALAAFFVAKYLFIGTLGNLDKKSLGKHEKTAAMWFVASSILIFLLTFPPVFGPIVEIFK